MIYSISEKINNQKVFCCAIDEYTKIMRKIILFAIFAFSAAIVMAQTNPKSGYVITNNGDTIRGIIDFRTNEKLSRQCDFWANGGSVKTTFKPGDIEVLDSRTTESTLLHAV